VFEVLKAELIPLNVEKVSAGAKRYAEGLRKVFCYGGFYYSNEVDLTRRVVGETNCDGSDF